MAEAEVIDPKNNWPNVRENEIVHDKHQPHSS